MKGGKTLRHVVRVSSNPPGWLSSAVDFGSFELRRRCGDYWLAV
jgi:hypothetical protein